MSQTSDSVSFTAADRIKQLNEIDRDVATLLQTAGLALQCLTNPANPSDPDLQPTVESHKEVFTAASQKYFALLASIDVRLRRQVYALEEAEIVIPEGDPRESTGGNAAREALAGELMDVSWLNSRKDTVAREMEGEVWAKAREFMETLEKDRKRGGANGAHGVGEGMDVD